MYTAWVLHPDVEIVGLSGEEIQSWWKLLVPSVLLSGSWALVVRGSDGRALRAVHKDHGAVDLGREAIDVGALPALRARLGCDALAVVDGDAWTRISRAAEPAALRAKAYVGQALPFYEAARRLSGKGLWMDPPLPSLLPPLREEALTRAFDLFVPNRTSLVAYVFDDRPGHVYASVIATKLDGVLDSIAMHPAISDSVPASSLRAWHTQYRSINDAVASHFAPPSISMFTDVAAVRRIQRGKSNQLAVEIASKNIIIDPMPTWLAGLMGGAAAAMIAGKSAQALSRFLPKGARRAAGVMAGAAKDRLRESGAHPAAVLGFDPMLLWQSLQSWYRAEPSV